MAPQGPLLPSLQHEEWPLESSVPPSGQPVFGPSQVPVASWESRPSVTRSSHLSKEYDLNSYVSAPKFEMLI